MVSRSRKNGGRLDRSSRLSESRNLKATRNRPRHNGYLPDFPRAGGRPKMASEGGMQHGPSRPSQFHPQKWMRRQPVDGHRLSVSLVDRITHPFAKESGFGGT
jgi:hypothetical protein